jgi:hypothetical protein
MTQPHLECLPCSERPKPVHAWTYSWREHWNWDPPEYAYYEPLELTAAGRERVQEDGTVAILFVESEYREPMPGKGEIYLGTVGKYARTDAKPLPWNEHRAETVLSAIRAIMENAEK